MVKTKDFKVSYGEAVGAVAAQSLGEPGTQMVLRAFHAAGISAFITTTGLPRFSEVVDGRKKIKAPSMVLKLESSFSKNYAKAESIKRALEEVVVGDLITGFDEDIRAGTMVLHFDKSKLEQKELTLKNITTKISENFASIEISQQASDMTIKHKGKRDIKSSRRTFVHIRELTVLGVPRIRRAFIQQEGSGVLYIATLGSNIAGAIAINGVDKDHLYSNDPFEVKSVFGIEAARNVIINEMARVLETEGIHVSYRHLMLCADAMTYTGNIKGVVRSGIVATKDSIFARATYEETIKHFVSATVYGEGDNLRGITENVLIGKQITVGTGRVRLSVKKEDLKKMKKSS